MSIGWRAQGRRCGTPRKTRGEGAGCWHCLFVRFFLVVWPAVWQRLRGAIAARLSRAQALAGAALWALAIVAAALWFGQPYLAHRAAALSADLAGQPVLHRGICRRAV